MPINNFREDEVMEQKINAKTILRLFAYLKVHRKAVLQTLLLMVVAVGVDVFNPFFMKLGIDKYIANKDRVGILAIGLVMLVLSLISMYTARFRMIKMSKVTNDILLTIRQELYTHIQKLSFSFFDSRPVGKILARIIGDVNSLNDLFTNSVTSLIPEAIKIIAVVSIMLVMNWRLALISLVTIPFMMIILILVSRFSHKGWQNFRKKSSNMNAFTHEDFSGIRVVQSFAAEKETSKTFWTLVTEWRQAFVSAVIFGDFVWPSVELSWGVGTIVVFSYGLALINTGTITIGLLVAFSSYIGMFWQPVMNISNFYNQLVTNITGAERIFEILDIEPDISDCQDCMDLPKIQGNVVFDHVSFAYEAGKPVLKNVSMQVREGETVALVGPTGVGKTTVVNLISRFYEAQGGRVLIDGFDVTKVSIESLRSQMGIMMQDSFLFSGTIRDNIRYGKLDATDIETEEAAKVVQAHEFIMQFEKGYDTDVNERGARLSGGQRQLIAFARALLADPQILILDEATASIDTHTEKLVQDGIKKLLKNRTSFVIAHRLSTIQSADRIMVIENGGISEAGTHAELMDAQGAYWKLFMAQFKYLKKEEVPVVGG